MNEKIKKILDEFVKAKWPTDGPLETDDDYNEILWEFGTEVAELDRDSHRWWDEMTIVKEFKISDDKKYYIGYCWASANRDESIFDLGWDFDSRTVALYKPKETVITTYVEV